MATTERILSATIRARNQFSNVANEVVRSSNQVRNATAGFRNSIVLKAKDMASRVINRVRVNLLAIKNTRLGQIVLQAKDMATRLIEKVKGKLRAFKDSRAYQIMLTAKDMASRVINTVKSKLKSFTGKTHQAMVSVKDKASSVLGGLKGKLAGLAAGATILITAKIGFDGLAAEQNQKITINRVIENSGASKASAKKATEEYYKYLEAFANKTPFTTSDVATMGTKAMMIGKGDVDYAKEVTNAMANTKAFVGEQIADCYGNVA